jgi:hypothetical protein
VLLLSDVHKGRGRDCGRKIGSTHSRLKHVRSRVSSHELVALILRGQAIVAGMLAPVTVRWGSIAPPGKPAARTARSPYIELIVSAPRDVRRSLFDVSPSFAACLQPP